MHTEEGRITLESSPEYQYHMKDHLGNVRLTFTTAGTTQQISTYLATMEPEATTIEAATFDNIESTQQTDMLFNHTPEGTTSARLNAMEDRMMGPSMTLHVMPGDTVKMQVQAKYLQKAKSKDPMVILGSMVAGALGVDVIDEAPQIAQGMQEIFTIGQAGLISRDNSVPKAFINYLFFDQDNEFKKGGFKQVSEQALGSFETLSLDYVPEEEGTMMIYTSNQTAEPLDVFMDDMMVLHTEGPIVRVDDYYPFGMTYRSSERSGFVTNQFRFQGHEHQEETGWDSFKWRNHQPDIGRFLSVDPLAEKYLSLSPYNFVANNPLKYIDPDGREIVDANGNPINYSAETGWTPNATPDVRRIGNSMLQTKVGREQLGAMISADTKVKLFLSSEHRISKDPTTGKTTVRYSETLITSFEENVDGTYTAKGSRCNNI